MSAGGEANAIAQQCCSKINGSQQHVTMHLVLIKLHTHGGAYIKSASSLLGDNDYHAGQISTATVLLISDELVDLLDP